MDENALVSEAQESAYHTLTYLNPRGPTTADVSSRPQHSWKLKNLCPILGLVHVELPEPCDCWSVRSSPI